MKERGRERELLVYNVKQGWGSLCELLDQDVPTDEEGGLKEFPRMNNETGYLEKMKEFQGVMAKEALTRMGLWIAGSVMVLGVGSWLNW